MAAAIIPVVAAALPVIQPILTNLIHLVEVHFGAGTGPTKLDTVISAGTAIAENLATAGKLPGKLDAATIGTVAQGIVSQLNANSQLSPQKSAAALAGTAQNLVLTGTFTAAP